MNILNKKKYFQYRKNNLIAYNFLKKTKIIAVLKNIYKNSDY